MDHLKEESTTSRQRMSLYLLELCMLEASRKPLDMSKRKGYNIDL
jgi:hypothetical protein